MIEKSKNLKPIPLLPPTSIRIQILHPTPPPTIYSQNPRNLHIPDVNTSNSKFKKLK